MPISVALRTVLPLCFVPFAALAQQASKPVQTAAVVKPVIAALPLKPAQTPEQQQAMLKKTLARLNASSAKFSSAEAHVLRVQHDHLVNQDTPQQGMLYVERSGSTAQFGVAMQQPGAKIVEYKGGVLRVDTPGACFNTYTQPDADSYVTLGFGGTAAELESKWTVTDLGPEKIDGKDTEKLSLVPRDPKVARTYTKVVIWIELDRDVTLKQVFYSTTDDTNTATYSNIVYNQKIKPGPYMIKDKACK